MPDRGDPVSTHEAPLVKVPLTGAAAGATSMTPGPSIA